MTKTARTGRRSITVERPVWEKAASRGRPDGLLSAAAVLTMLLAAYGRGDIDIDPPPYECGARLAQAPEVPTEIWKPAADRAGLQLSPTGTGRATRTDRAVVRSMSELAEVLLRDYAEGRVRITAVHTRLYMAAA
ncbi:hypothetical protein ACWF95_36320 [Streptomyces vinaceus]